MRDKNNHDDNSRLIDKFQIVANSSNCNKAVSIDGELGIASITFKTELSCAEVAACQLTTDTTLDDCSKISNTNVNYFILSKIMVTTICIQVMR